MVLLGQHLAETISRRVLTCAWIASLLAMLLTVGQTASADELHAEKILSWEFQRSEDRNNDQWPDGWRRRSGRDFPGYIPVRIQPRDPEMARAAREAEPALSRLWMKYQSGKYFKQYIPERTPEPIAKFIDLLLINNCLTIDMDGGAVHLESPAFLLDSRFTYTLEGSISTRGLDGHKAWVELLLLDGEGHEIVNAKSQTSEGSTPWHAISTSSLSSEALKMGQIVVHVEPQKTQRLNGQVRIDELRLYRMPKLELKIDAPYHVATPGQAIDVSCTVLGIADARSSVNFKLVDHLGTVCQQTLAHLAPVEPGPAASVIQPLATSDKTPSQARPGKLTAKSTPEPLSQSRRPCPLRAPVPCSASTARRTGSSRSTSLATTASSSIWVAERPMPNRDRSRVKHRWPLSMALDRA